ncbi:gluconokinase, partial [Acinetobacter baumannii]
DRVPWLQKVRSRAISASSQNGVVIACSALKQVYRNLLEENLINGHWIFLDGDWFVLYERLNSRKNHYMPASLLHSQLATLERPEKAIRINA